MEVKAYLENHSLTVGVDLEAGVVLMLVDDYVRNQDTVVIDPAFGWEVPNLIEYCCYHAVEHS